ncbi:MAG: DUF6048 family protein [Chryseolinea sp.]
MSSCLTGFAQTEEKSADSVKVRPSYKPTGVRFGSDVISIIRSSSDKTFDGWEFNADADFDRYYGTLDVGYWARDYVAPDGTYSNNGTYFRIGADANFLKKDPDKNMFFFGLRYGHSRFSENLTVIRDDADFGNVSIKLINSHIPAGWFEMTTGLKVKMWKFFWLGCTARLKFGLSTGEKGDLKPSDVPGFGRTDKQSVWGFNYQILFRIPIKKAPSIPLEK